ncbi:hypothetical protein ACQP2E_12395 [Actinoplanes sp. CA-015351]|uniref:hypothetical protein n=1 Tax=Actinoplanes sp. CA-015351 TaxID=3239897 RepID=UPI003D99B9E1
MLDGNGPRLRRIRQDRRLRNPGDTADFNAGQPHWFGPADNRPAEILHRFGPHGDHPTHRNNGVDG